MAASPPPPEITHYYIVRGLLRDNELTSVFRNLFISGHPPREIFLVKRVWSENSENGGSRPVRNSIKRKFQWKSGLELFYLRLYWKECCVWRVCTCDIGIQRIDAWHKTAREMNNVRVNIITIVKMSQQVDAFFTLFDVWKGRWRIMASRRCNGRMSPQNKDFLIYDDCREITNITAVYSTKIV